MDISQNYLKDLWLKCQNFRRVTVTGKRGTYLNVNLGYGTVRAQCLTDVAGDAIALQTDQGNWYVIGASPVERNIAESRQLVFRATKPKKPITQAHIKILYYDWATDGTFQWYVGGFSPVPVTLFSENAESVEHPDGVFFTESDLSNIVAYADGAFVATVGNRYTSQNSNYINRVTGSAIAPVTFRSEKLHYINSLNLQNDRVTYPTNITGYSHNKTFRHFGEGNILSKHFVDLRNEFNTYHETIPPEYFGNIYHIRPDGKSSIENAISSTSDTFNFNFEIPELKTDVSYSSTYDFTVETIDTITYDGKQTARNLNGESVILAGYQDILITETITFEQDLDGSTFGRAYKYYANGDFQFNLNSSVGFRVFNTGNSTTSGTVIQNIEVSELAIDQIVEIRADGLSTYDTTLGSAIASPVYLAQLESTTPIFYNRKFYIAKGEIVSYNSVPSSIPGTGRVIEVKITEAPRLANFCSVCSSSDRTVAMLSANHSFNSFLIAKTGGLTQVVKDSDAVGYDAHLNAFTNFKKDDPKFIFNSDIVPEYDRTLPTSDPLYNQNIKFLDPVTQVRETYQIQSPLDRKRSDPSLNLQFLANYGLRLLGRSLYVIPLDFDFNSTLFTQQNTIYVEQWDILDNGDVVLNSDQVGVDVNQLILRDTVENLTFNGILDMSFYVE